MAMTQHETTERTVYGTRIGPHWAFVVSSYNDLLRFSGQVTTAEYPCEHCGRDQMRLVHLVNPDDPTTWALSCLGCWTFYAIVQMPARQCNGQGE